MIRHENHRHTTEFVAMMVSLFNGNADEVGPFRTVKLCPVLRRKRKTFS